MLPSVIYRRTQIKGTGRNTPRDFVVSDFINNHLAINECEAAVSGARTHKFVYLVVYGGRTCTKVAMGCLYCSFTIVALVEALHMGNYPPRIRNSRVSMMVD
jgi:hypothetical protein